MDNRKVILYIATSLDGFIAKPGDDLSFLSMVEKEGEDYGYSRFVASVDTVIMGRKTYDWITSQVAYPHPEMTSYILTRTEKPPIGTIHFYSGDVAGLINKLKQLPGKNIFCDGGAEVVNLLLKNNLIDEIILSVIPIILGDGVRLFHRDQPELKLKLIHAKSFSTGLVQLHYKRS